MMVHFLLDAVLLDFMGSSLKFFKIMVTSFGEFSNFRKSLQKMPLMCQVKSISNSNLPLKAEGSDPC